ADRGDYAVRADEVAAWRDLDPALDLRLALHRQVSGDVLELEVALRGERIRGQELGKPMDLSGPEGDVDEGEAAEYLVLDRLRPAAADTNDARRILRLEALCLT